jgi:hypothetical protein
VIERKIKELSIALEALSRINGFTATDHFGRVSDLLGEAIKEAKEYYTPYPKPSVTDDDNIPF